MQSTLMTVVDYCVTEVLKQPKRPLLIAITGDSGSGKSYITLLIKNELEKRGHTSLVVNHDDFLISRSDREPMKAIFYEGGEFAGKSHWEILENMFRLEEFGRVISELKEGKETSYFPYSRDTGKVSESPSYIRPAEINIFDSSMMVERMDYVVLVDVTQENIIERKLKRDLDIRTPEQIVDMHKKVQGYYWSRRKPDDADIVIDNNDFEKIHIK